MWASGAFWICQPALSRRSSVGFSGHSSGVIRSSLLHLVSVYRSVYYKLATAMSLATVHATSRASINACPGLEPTRLMVDFACGLLCLRDSLHVVQDSYAGIHCACSEAAGNWYRMQIESYGTQPRFVRYFWRGTRLTKYRKQTWTQLKAE